MKNKKEIQKKFRYSFLLLFIAGLLMGQNVLAQGITVSGVVKNANGEALTGVVISAEGTSIGAVTGLDGDFSLSVPQGTTLSFSQLGFQTQKARAAAGMNITLMEDNATTLQAVEVVGVGYGTMRRGDLTGAIASVNAGNMRQGIITSSEQILQGKIAGLNVVQGSGDPAAGAVMRLRGGSSLAGNSAPLIVVDGIAGVDINTVQSSDIVSVDVLKDASAAAIYGSRGASGVIIVTTSRKPTQDQVTTSANYAGYIGIANASKKLDLLTADNWTEHNSEPDANYGHSTDWQDAVQQTAITQSHALTFSSGSNKGGFNGALSYLNSEGVIITTNMERYGASFSGFTKVWDNRLTLEGGMHTTIQNYRHLDTGGSRGYHEGYGRLFRSIYGMNPTLPVLNTDGSFAQDPLGKPAHRNPIEFLENRLNDRSRDRLLTFAKAELSIWDGLKGTINLSRNHVVEDNRLYVKRNADELRASMYQIDAVGNGGRATTAFSDWTEYQFEGYLTYDKILNSIHRMNFMGGYSYSETVAKGHGAGVFGFQTDDFLYNNLEAALNKQYAYSYKNSEKLISFFGRANYTYKSKYMLTATLRADGSSKFGANHKWGYFPSASAAWRITDEDFMQSVKGSWLNDLKLRAGYGITGNQGGIPPYGSLEGYAASKEFIINRTEEPIFNDDGELLGSTVRIVNVRNPNPDLKWESTQQFNAGLDFQIFRDITGSIEVYHKNTKDLLYFLKVEGDGVTTYPYLLKNIGSMTNTGIEFSLNAIVMQNRDKKFKWDVNLNLAHNKNKITDLEGGAIFPAGMLMYVPTLSPAYTQRIQEGYSIGSFFGAKYVGKDENGTLLYRMADGSTTARANEAEQVYLGNAMPKLSMGLGTTVAYRNFDLSVNFNGLFGQKVYNGTAMDLHNIGDRAYSNILESTLTDGQAAGISDYWLENASFLRLQTVTLGYTFDLKKIKLNSLRVYATAENLFVLTKYSGVDPEVSIDMNVTQELDENKVFPGIDYYNNYPKPRTFLFGVNLSF